MRGSLRIHGAKADTDGNANAAAAAEPDNTEKNKRDRKDGAVTADSAKNDKSDIQIMAKIRRTVVKDKSLSSNAHNVKIVSQNGVVTLKGPVHSADEKTAVERIATEVAGAANVKSEIEIKP